MFESIFRALMLIELQGTFIYDITGSGHEIHAGAQRLALFGFVFSSPFKAIFAVIPFPVKIYADLPHRQIGFVFSNWFPLNSFISDLELIASDFRSKAG